MKTTPTVPQGEDTAIQCELYMSFELGDKSWKLTVSDGGRVSSHANSVDCTRKGHARAVGKACGANPSSTDGVLRQTRGHVAQGR